MPPRLRRFLGRVRRFLRTTAVRLSVVYLLVFTLIAWRLNAAYWKDVQ